jgi:hypothetical protein
MAKAAGSKIGVKVLLAFFCSLMMHGQQIDTLSMPAASNGPLLGQLVVDGDTVPWSVLDEMLFVAKPTLNDFQARRNYYILMKKVGRVYPYVREAALRMDSVNLQLEGIDRRRQRRKYTKSYQKYLEERFEPELRKLTRSEGQILSKLIYRETHTSVYEIIKTYRNVLSARFWSMTAWWYDIDLKRPYDPENDAEDRLIENILLRKFISGELIPARTDERNVYQR